jgi:uncharacterized protein
VKIFLAGGTGFLGCYLCRAFIRNGHEVTVLTRTPVKKTCLEQGLRVISGNPLTEGDWQEQLAGHEAVINLTGASIFQRWTKQAKREIFESRILSTSHIVDAMKRSMGKETVLFNASGVGYYGTCEDAMINERITPGITFLAKVASAWEQTAQRAEEAGIRVVLCRFGIVLGRYGGAFPRLLTLTRFRLSIPWGSGEQWFSWIHEKDVERIFAFLLENKDIMGPVNFTSPMPVKNSEMTAILNYVLKKRPFLSVIPGWFLRSILGEFSQVFLVGQRVLPEVLTDHGFVFRFPALRETLADLVQYEEKI